MFGDFQLNAGIFSPIRVHQAEQAVIGQLTSTTQVASLTLYFIAFFRKSGLSARAILAHAGIRSSDRRNCR
jgi:hypothetical protein